MITEHECDPVLASIAEELASIYGAQIITRPWAGLVGQPWQIKLVITIPPSYPSAGFGETDETVVLDIQWLLFPTVLRLDYRHLSAPGPGRLIFELADPTSLDRLLEAVRCEYTRVETHFARYRHSPRGTHDRQ